MIKWLALLASSKAAAVCSLQLSGSGQNVLFFFINSATKEERFTKALAYADIMQPCIEQLSFRKFDIVSALVWEANKNTFTLNCLSSMLTSQCQFFIFASNLLYSLSSLLRGQISRSSSAQVRCMGTSHRNLMSTLLFTSIIVITNVKQLPSENGNSATWYPSMGQIHGVAAANYSCQLAMLAIAA